MRRGQTARLPERWRPWQALVVGIALGIAGTLGVFAAGRSVRPAATTPASAAATVFAAAAHSPDPYYVVVEKHYLDLGTSDDTMNWFYGTVRNDGHARGTCNVIAYFFDEEDRSIEVTVVPIKPLDPGQLTTFHMHPTVQNAESGGVKFTANCGHGIMWHYIP